MPRIPDERINELIDVINKIYTPIIKQEREYWDLLTALLELKQLRAEKRVNEQT